MFSNAEAVGINVGINFCKEFWVRLKLISSASLRGGFPKSNRYTSLRWRKTVTTLFMCMLRSTEHYLFRISKRQSDLIDISCLYMLPLCAWFLLFNLWSTSTHLLQPLSSYFPFFFQYGFCFSSRSKQKFSWVIPHISKVIHN